MNEISVAWAAGLLEGEGCFSIFQRKGKDYKTCAVHCEMTDQDTLERLHEALPFSLPVRRLKQRGNRKESWIVSAQNQKSVESICNLIYPYMSNRRKQKIKEILDYYASRSN